MQPRIRREARVSKTPKLAGGGKVPCESKMHLTFKAGLPNCGLWPQSVRTMANNIKKYLALRNALLTEKANLESRLQQISQVIGQEPPVAASTPVATPGRRKFSEATKAKMRAAQQARWAKKKGKAGKAAAPGPKKQRKMTAEGRAAISAAAKARWAKAKAAGKSTLAG